MGDGPAGTDAYLFTDIEGSTQLLRRLGERYTAVLLDHYAILRSAIASTGGGVVVGTGKATRSSRSSTRARCPGSCRRAARPCGSRLAGRHAGSRPDGHPLWSGRVPTGPMGGPRNPSRGANCGDGAWRPDHSVRSGPRGRRRCDRRRIDARPRPAPPARLRRAGPNLAGGCGRSADGAPAPSVAERALRSAARHSCRTSSAAPRNSRPSAASFWSTGLMTLTGPGGSGRPASRSRLGAPSSTTWPMGSHSLPSPRSGIRRWWPMPFGPRSHCRRSRRARRSMCSSTCSAPRRCC